MEEQTKYFVLKQKAVPEVLLKVVEAKKTDRIRARHHDTGGHGESGDQQKFLL